MNKVFLSGNLTRNLELKQTQTGHDMMRNCIAVRSARKNADGSYSTDFFEIVVYDATAKYMCQRCQKGSQITLTGNIVTGSYQNKNGSNVPTFTIICEEVIVMQQKEEQPQQPVQPVVKQVQEVTEAEAVLVADDDLPF